MGNLDKIIDRRGTNSIKYDNLQEMYGTEDLLPMWVADTDFSVPECISNAIRERVDHNIYGYTFRGQDAIDSFIGWSNRRYDWDIKNEWVTSSPGVVTGLSMSIMALSKEGDKILIQPPVYPPFFQIVRDTGRRIVESPLAYEDGRYSMDFEDLERKFSGGIKIMIFCNPHNPVGRAWSREELKRLGDLCVKYNVLLLSDEIHADLYLPGNKHIPMASVSKEIANVTITAMAPSKTFNVAGLSSSIVIIPNAEIKEKYEGILNALHLGLGNVFGHTALKAGYTCADEWVDELMQYIKCNVDFTRDFLKDNLPDVRMIEPDATFLLWLDFSKYGKTNNELNDLFVKKGKIALNNGNAFGVEGEGFFRLNIGCPQSILKEGLERIVKALK